MLPASAGQHTANAALYGPPIRTNDLDFTAAPIFLTSELFGLFPTLCDAMQRASLVIVPVLAASTFETVSSSSPYTEGNSSRLAGEPPAWGSLKVGPRRSSR